MKTYSLADIAQFLGVRYEGDGSVQITAIANLKDASSSHISFLSDKRYASVLSSTNAGAVIVGEKQAVPAGMNVIRVPNPYLAYARISELFVKLAVPEPGVHDNATVALSAKISASASIGPGCVIEEYAEIGADTCLQANVFVGQGAKIGERCTVYANTTVYHHVSIGDRVIIHSNTTIGSDGFGFAPSPDGWQKIHQLGAVIVGHDVEIGAGCTIDRGAINNTIIHDRVIIDNQVHIAHNCEIGEATAIAGCTGIAGSTKIGKRCLIGGGVGIGGHLEIGDDISFNGGTNVTKSIKEPGHYSSGTPVQEVKLWRKNAVRQGQLHEWVERLKQLEQSLSSEQDTGVDAD